MSTEKQNPTCPTTVPDPERPIKLPEDPHCCGMILEFIFVAIVNDAGKHGDFLKAFARAYLLADWENRDLLRPSAVALVEKYGLIKHFQGHAE
jgi:hypothetical protein